MLIIPIVLFVILLLLGVPIWAVLGISGGWITLFSMELPAMNIPSHFFSNADQWILLAVPYFLLAGNLMTNMGSAKKMLVFINDLMGHLPGGLATATVVTATIFGALSGSAVATVIAVGSMVVPQMIALGYSKHDSYGLVVASGTLGQMIPPSIAMILFAAIVQMNVGDLFLAGIVPGILIAVMLIITTIIVGTREKAKRKERTPLPQLRISFLQSIPALLMPFIVLGGIYSGKFTPTEAAAIAVFYVILISFLFNRKEFTLDNLLKSFRSSMITTAAIYIIFGGAGLFSTSLTFAQIPQQLTEFVTGINLPGWVIMLLIVLLLLVFGTFLDAAPIIFITVPILYPVVISLGYDPIHFAIVLISCMMIGQITPPVGMSLFAISGHFKESILTVTRGTIPYLYALLIAILVLLFVPWFSTFLIK